MCYNNFESEATTLLLSYKHYLVPIKVVLFLYILP
nr:MAG TPA: hypothetical protein [Caudoviricetes sp.]